MEDTELYETKISKNFLKHINELTKMSIKVYISLVYLKHKRGDYFKASHREISINHFEDDVSSGECFGIRTDSGQYFKAFKQLEELGLIKRYQHKAKSGIYKANSYCVY